MSFSYLIKEIKETCESIEQAGNKTLHWELFTGHRFTKQDNAKLENINKDLSIIAKKTLKMIRELESDRNGLPYSRSCVMNILSNSITIEKYVLRFKKYIHDKVYGEEKEKLAKEIKEEEENLRLMQFRCAGTSHNAKLVFSHVSVHHLASRMQVEEEYQSTKEEVTERVSEKRTLEEVTERVSEERTLEKERPPRKLAKLDFFDDISDNIKRMLRSKRLHGSEDDSPDARGLKRARIADIINTGVSSLKRSFEMAIPSGELLSQGEDLIERKKRRLLPHILSIFERERKFLFGPSAPTRLTVGAIPQGLNIVSELKTLWDADPFTQAKTLLDYTIKMYPLFKTSIAIAVSANKGFVAEGGVIKFVATEAEGEIIRAAGIRLLALVGKRFLGPQLLSVMSRQLPFLSSMTTEVVTKKLISLYRYSLSIPKLQNTFNENAHGLPQTEEEWKNQNMLNPIACGIMLNAHRRLYDWERIKIMRKLRDSIYIEFRRTLSVHKEERRLLENEMHSAVRGIMGLPDTESLEETRGNVSLALDELSKPFKFEIDEEHLFCFAYGVFVMCSLYTVDRKDAKDFDAAKRYIDRTQNVFRGPDLHYTDELMYTSGDYFGTHTVVDGIFSWSGNEDDTYMLQLMNSQWDFSKEIIERYKNFTPMNKLEASDLRVKDLKARYKILKDQYENERRAAMKFAPIGATFWAALMRASRTHDYFIKSLSIGENKYLSAFIALSGRLVSERGIALFYTMFYIKTLRQNFSTGQREGGYMTTEDVANQFTGTVGSDLLMNCTMKTIDSPKIAYACSSKSPECVLSSTSVGGAWNSVYNGTTYTLRLDPDDPNMIGAQEILRSGYKVGDANYYLRQDAFSIGIEKENHGALPSSKWYMFSNAVILGIGYFDPETAEQYARAKYLISKSTDVFFMISRSEKSSEVSESLNMLLSGFAVAGIIKENPRPYIAAIIASAATTALMNWMQWGHQAALYFEEERWVLAFVYSTANVALTVSKMGTSWLLVSAGVFLGIYLFGGPIVWLYSAVTSLVASPFFSVQLVFTSLNLIYVAKTEYDRQKRLKQEIEKIEAQGLTEMDSAKLRYLKRKTSYWRIIASVLKNATPSVSALFFDYFLSDYMYLYPIYFMLTGVVTNEMKLGIDYKSSGARHATAAPRHGIAFELIMEKKNGEPEKLKFEKLRTQEHLKKVLDVINRIRGDENIGMQVKAELIRGILQMTTLPKQ